MAEILSLNLGSATADSHASLGVSGIDKRPVDGYVEVRAPGPKGTGGSGLAGDDVCDRRHHGGDDQAVYAYAREDLDAWGADLGRSLPSGMFGENLTTVGVDVTGALVGERWRVGDRLVLQVTDPRIPCRTFAGRMGEPGWVATFTARALPGAYLRVVEPGRIRAGDSVTVVSRPDHRVTVALVFRALTREPDLLPELLAADALPEETRARALARLPFDLGTA